ncbi:MAG: hypothetical protein IT373_35435 [Polyangiaceae bacterium]|nr:hypothetical protein [Polyangiaceae bacterium]
MYRSALRVVATCSVAAALLLATTGCQFIGKSSSSPSSGAGTVDPERARETLGRARKAREAGKLYEARQLLADAGRLADDAVRADIDQLAAELDAVEAETLVAPVLEAAKKGDCQLALSQTARAHDRAHGTMSAIIRKATEEPLRSCLEAALAKPDGKTLVRRLLDKARTEELLGAAAFRAVADAVTKLLVDEVMTELGPLLRDRKWSEARGRIDDLVARDKIGRRERQKLLAELQTGLAVQVVARAKEAPGKDKIGSASPEAVLAEVDALIAEGGWRAPDGSGEGAPWPEELRLARRALAVWIECRELQCKTSTPRRVWAFGAVGLQPATEPAAAERKLAHGTPLWQIADTKGWALVLEGEPAQSSSRGFAELAGRAAGWVRTGDVKTDDTRRLLPPGDALVGLRVWGPLRKGEANLELGTVVSADETNATVRRLADHQEVTVPRATLRFGLVDPGTRVLAQCKGALAVDPGRIEAVVETGDDPMVNVTCLDAGGAPTGGTRNGPLGGLRNKAEWLDR